MRVTVLMENSTPSDRLCARHGLSLFLETAEHRILFDMGPDDAFLANAQALGVDVAAADIAVLSHGHFDHAGGLGAYLKETADAPNLARVYVARGAFGQHMAKTPAGTVRDIGADPALAASPRIVEVGEELSIDAELTLFSHVEPAELAPKSNAVLLEPDGSGGWRPDAFSHEQSLLVRERGADGVSRSILVSGCSHCGIVNILKRAEALNGGPLDAVVAGMHLMDPGSGSVEDPAVTAAIAQLLAGRPTRYYTYHCTGLAAFSLLRDTLGERVTYLNAGARIEV